LRAAGRTPLQLAPRLARGRFPQKTMGISKSFSAACALLLIAASPGIPSPARAQNTWDNLVQTPSRRFNQVFLAPGADFRPYTKVMLDPTEVAFQRNFVRNFNSSGRGLSRRISDADAERMLADMQMSFAQVFTRALTDGGYKVVTEPGPDVLRLRTAVINLSVNAPERPSAGRRRTFAPQAGQATLVLEARDSVTGAILGRAVDPRVVGDMGGMVTLRSGVSNRADFERQFRTWAQDAIRGFEALKATPAPAGG
jgi:hypothetical protein